MKNKWRASWDNERWGWSQWLGLLVWVAFMAWVAWH